MGGRVFGDLGYIGNSYYVQWCVQLRDKCFVQICSQVGPVFPSPSSFLSEESPGMENSFQQTKTRNITTPIFTFRPEICQLERRSSHGQSLKRGWDFLGGPGARRRARQALKVQPQSPAKKEKGWFGWRRSNKGKPGWTKTRRHQDWQRFLRRMTSLSPECWSKIWPQSWRPSDSLVPIPGFHEVARERFLLVSEILGLERDEALSSSRKMDPTLNINMMDPAPRCDSQPPRTEAGSSRSMWSMQGFCVSDSDFKILL